MHMLSLQLLSWHAWKWSTFHQALGSFTEGLNDPYSAQNTMLVELHEDAIAREEARPSLLGLPTL